MTKPDSDIKLPPGTVVLVTGATGVIGPALLRLLLQEELEVRALILSETEAVQVPEGVTIYIGDIRDPGSVLKAGAGVDVIFHLAAKLHIYDPDLSLAEEYEQINVDGTRHVVETSIKLGIARIVFFSTINVYGVGDEDRFFMETSELSPKSLYANTKSSAEKIILSACSKGDGKPLGVVLRLAAVYGPGMRGNYISLLSGLKQGWFLPIGPSQNRRTLIYIDDAVRAALLAASHPKATGNIYNLTDGQVYSLRNIIDAMCEGLGKRPPLIHLPVKPIRFGIGLIEDIFQLIGYRFPFGRRTIDAMLEDRAVSGNKIQKELGFSPQIELVEGWRRVVDDVYL